MPQPTVGRVVYFKTVGNEKHPESVTVAAIITKVHEDGKVALTCFLPLGGIFYRKSVSEGNEGGTWQWPPRV